jgi:hypothetical protein
MAILAFRTSTYARNIYLYGTSSFSTIDQEYVPYVKKYAAEKFARQQIDDALAKGYITHQEYDETIALIPVQ